MSGTEAVEQRGRPGNPRLLVAVAGQGAALATALPVLLFRREEIAERLGVVGAVVGEAALIGAAAVVAALVVPRLRSVLPAGILLTLAGLLAAAGLTVMARTTGIAMFTAGGIMLAVAAAPVAGAPPHPAGTPTPARPTGSARCRGTGPRWPPARAGRWRPACSPPSPTAPRCGSRPRWRW